MDSLSSKHPLLILKELEQFFSEKHSPDIHPHAETWSGLGVLIGSLECVIENHNIQEILLPDVLNNLSRVPGAKPWLKGLISIRGQAMPIIDLSEFLFKTTCTISANTRVLILNLGDFHCGVLIEKSLGLKRIEQYNLHPFNKDVAHGNASKVASYFKYELKLDKEIWPVLDITELDRNPDFRNMAGS